MSIIMVSVFELGGGGGDGRVWGIITIMKIPCQQLAGYSKLLVSE